MLKALVASLYVAIAGTALVPALPDGTAKMNFDLSPVSNAIAKADRLDAPLAKADRLPVPYDLHAGQTLIIAYEDGQNAVSLFRVPLAYASNF
jgi:hypothetical protein